MLTGIHASESRRVLDRWHADSATGTPDPDTVTQGIEQDGMDVINTTHEMVAAEKVGPQQKNWRTAGREAVKRLKNAKKFDFGMGLKFTTYLTWAVQNMEKLGVFREKQLTNPSLQCYPDGVCNLAAVPSRPQADRAANRRMLHFSGPAMRFRALCDMGANL
jgi:hypothetical protein